MKIGLRLNLTLNAFAPPVKISRQNFFATVLDGFSELLPVVA
jgi:hypothetical protein